MITETRENHLPSIQLHMGWVTDGWEAFPRKVMVSTRAGGWSESKVAEQPQELSEQMTEVPETAGES